MKTQKAEVKKKKKNPILGIFNFPPKEYRLKEKIKTTQ